MLSLWVIANNLEHLAKYGISNAQELATEQALILGRQAIGVVFNLYDEPDVSI